MRREGSRGVNRRKNEQSVSYVVRKSPAADTNRDVLSLKPERLGDHSLGAQLSNDKRDVKKTLTGSIRSRGIIMGTWRRTKTKNSIMGKGLLGKQGNVRCRRGKEDRASHRLGYSGKRGVLWGFSGCWWNLGNPLP